MRIRDERVAFSYWIWGAWLETAQDCRFIYGCSAPCTRAPGWQDVARDKELLGAKLTIREATVEEPRFRSFADHLAAGKIELGLVFGTKSSALNIAETRHVLEAGLGQTAARVTAHYTQPDLAELTGNDDSRLPLLLDCLEQELGLPFKTTHATRLGNFDQFDLHPWLERSQPFLVEAVSPDVDGGASTYRICRTSDFAAAEHRAHIVGRVNGDVILDRLLVLPKGELHRIFEVAERLDEIEFRLFDANGDLLHSEKNAFMNRIGFVLAPVHRQVSIEDDLSVRAGQARRAASVVRSHSSMRSLVGGPKPGSWRKFAEDVAHTVALRAPVSSEDKWFPRGIEGELGAIAHLNRLLDGGSARRAVLVDPWFGIEALHQLTMRLASVDIEITILTSWLDKDPRHW